MVAETLMRFLCRGTEVTLFVAFQKHLCHKVQQCSAYEHSPLCVRGAQSCQGKQQNNNKSRATQDIPLYFFKNWTVENQSWVLKTLTDDIADKPLNSSQASSVNFSLLFHRYVKCQSALLIGITHAVSVEDLCYLVQESNHFFILERLKSWVRGVIIVCVPCIKLPIEFCVTYKMAWDV